MTVFLLFWQWYEDVSLGPAYTTLGDAQRAMELDVHGRRKKPVESYGYEWGPSWREDVVELKNHGREGFHGIYKVRVKEAA
jgi:hypothetical protein